MCFVHGGGGGACVCESVSLYKLYNPTEDHTGIFDFIEHWNIKSNWKLKAHKYNSFEK